MSEVHFSQVTKRFGGQAGQGGAVAVKGLDLRIEPGTMVTLLGPSGCGKTTTLRMLAGFETPSEGAITIGGADITHVPVNARGIGMVFQSYALFPHLTVRQNVEYGLRSQGVPAAETARRTAEMLETMHLAALAERAPSQLSGGQQQRVALARAVVTRPKVLLFDEPLSNLDAQLRERMRDELRAIQLRFGITSLYVTHDQSEAMAISDRVVVMRNGVIEQDDAPPAIYARPKTEFVARFMGRANILSAPVVRRESGEVGLAIAGETIAAPLSGGDYRPGDRVRCVLRPEHARLEASGAPLTVRRVVYQGSHVEYLVVIDGQDCTVLDNLYHRNGIAAVGETIHVSLAGAPLWIIGPASDEAQADKAA